MSIESKLQALLTASNNKTGETDTTLTDAVQSLIDGYGGGGAYVPHIDSVTEYIHTENWTNDAIGNAENFVNVYCSRLNSADKRVYICYITNNTATQIYRANFVMFFNGPGGMNIRNNWTNESSVFLASRSFYISAGAKVTVIVFKTGESEGE